MHARKANRVPPVESRPCITCGRPALPGEKLCRECSSSGEVAPTADLGTDNAQHLEPQLASRDRRPALALGHRFGPRYTIVEQVGSGGMGTVYKAHDAETGRTVALKLIRADVLARVGSLSRFKRELALAQTVSHANVYRVHDLGEVDGNAYISMEYVDGQSLDELIHSVGHLSPRQTVTIGRQICGGLQAIHEKSIVHRDLKPSNIMVDYAGVARLMDFGLAYQTGSEHLTSEGQILGTMAYLSPEQARGARVGPTSDVFALGLILYEMLTGRRPPGDGQPFPFALRGREESCPRPSHFVPEIPKVVDAIVMRCLERDPNLRFPSAAALGEALAALAAASTSGVSLRSLRGATDAFVVQRSRPWPWVLAAAALAVSLGFAAWAWRGGHPAPPRSNAPVVLGVLPFTTSPADPTAADAAAGLAEGLATDIGDGKCATVVPRGEMARLTNRSAILTAQRLGLTHILSGTIVSAPPGYRAEINLLTSSGDIVARVVDRDPDAFALQRRFADEVLGVLCSGQERPAHAAQAGTTDPAAFLEYARGLRLLDRQDQAENLEGAVAALRNALSIDPRFALAHAVLGEAYLAQHRLNADGLLAGKALNAATEALRSAPSHPRARLLYARAKREMGEKEAAASELRALVKERSRDPEIRAALGALYVEQADWPGALAEYQEALRLRPNYWGSYARLGYAYLRMGRTKDAIAAYKRGTELQSDNAEAFQMLGTAYQIDGDMKSAASSLKRAVDIRPTAFALLNLGTIAYDDGDFATARRYYDEAVSLDAMRASHWLGLGDARNMLGDKAQARRAWAECARLSDLEVGLDKDNALAMAEGALCRLKLGKRAEARLAMDRAVTLAPRDGEVLYQRALVLALEGLENEAVEALARAIESGYSAKRAERDHELRGLRKHPGFRDALGSQPARGG